MKSSPQSPYAWMPSLYFAEAVPYAVVMTLSMYIYFDMGLTNTQLALYTSWLYLPWVVKPLWSPLVDALRTKRWWIVSMQIVIAAALSGVTFTLSSSFWLTASLLAFWLMAFSSATHDIAADGFYILALKEEDQAFYVGWRSTAYKLGTLFVTGLLVAFVGGLKDGYLSVPYYSFSNAQWIDFLINLPKLSPVQAWMTGTGILAALMTLLVMWHYKSLPSVEQMETIEKRSEAIARPSELLKAFRKTLHVFFSKPGVLAALFFMLLFRFPEAQLAKMAQPFMQRELLEGGLELSTTAVGFAYGTIGLIGLLFGGIVGGYLVSRHGLRRWWWPMVMAISIPDLVYVYFALCQPTNIYLIYIGVALEQLGYGFGFTAYSLFLVYFSRGERSTSVFSLCTALQALGMMLPGMMAGWLADTLGFTLFFAFVSVCCLITFAVSALVKLPEEKS